MKKHFVTFYSPGTFVSEQTTEPISNWDVYEAVKMADKITERYGATPYGFSFSTRERTEKDLDSRETKTSHMHYLGGKILTLQQIKARKDPKDEILISNMETNNFDKIIENTNSWRITLPLNKEDVVLPYTPPPKKKSLTSTSIEKALKQIHK
jgi:hypothetical protein